jgi:photosystem II stability/assembly factor-like uncharacterized protein
MVTVGKARSSLQRKPSMVLDVRGSDDAGSGNVNSSDLARSNASSLEALFERGGMRRRAFDRGLSPTAGAGGGGGGAGSSRLGVGLRAGSPWLALATRKKRGWAVGMNIKQTLALVAGSPTSVNWFDINPEDSRDIRAATADGLIQSRDGGDSWETVLSGVSRKERYMFHVVTNPHNSRQIYIGTGLGLFISKDGGQSFNRSINPLLARARVNFTLFHKTDPDLVYICASFGLFRSRDGGKNFSYIYRSSWPPDGHVKRVAIDEGNKQRVMIGTKGGIFISEDGGDTFDRGGASQFTGFQMREMTAGESPGHFLAATYRDLWETFDGGSNWRVIDFNSVGWGVQHAFFSPHDPATIHLLTRGEVMKLVPATPSKLPEGLRTRFRALTQGEPSLRETLLAATKHNGVYTSDVLNYKRRSRFATLLPKVKAGFYARQIDLDHDFEQPFILPDEVLSQNIGGLDTVGFEVYATWDLRRLVFSRDETPNGRVYSVTRRAEKKIKALVVSLYRERQRLLIQSLLDSDRSESFKMKRRLRLEELTAHLNVLSGDLFNPTPALGSETK